jgi:ATP synthase protein I
VPGGLEFRGRDRKKWWVGGFPIDFFNNQCKKITFARGACMPDDKKSEIKTGLAIASAGIEMVVAMAVGYLFGSWLDGRFGTAPWLTGIFFGFGVAAAFLGLYRNAKRYWPKD